MNCNNCLIWILQYTVAVVGGGPSGACADEIFAQEKNI